MSNLRIRTTPGVDKNIQLKVEQDFDFLEILSLKISQQDLYSSFCANYGVVVGRVIANKGFGVDNAKVSVFVPITSEDEKNDLIKDLYPFKSTATKDKNGRRYNLLLSESTCNLNKAVGSFPTKEEVLDNDVILEIYDKYYKYTTKTNEAGDYMIFGVPIGQHTVHYDVDLSDSGSFSARPYDFIANGYPENLFESRVEFKDSEDLDSLPQIKSGDKSVDVLPFWGDEEICQVGITRVDFDTNFNFTPTSLFFGSIFSDAGKNSINKRCKPSKDLGEQSELRTGTGRIEMIRVSELGLDNNGELTEPIALEEFTVEGGDLIDDDGVFAFPVPMNTHHMVTDEFGNLVLSNDPEVGIPTKGMYRMKMNFLEPPENLKRRTAHMIFPSLSSRHGGTEGYTTNGQGNDIGGTEDQRWTDDINQYKDLFLDFHTFEWKQVYTIAHYIKKYKKGSNRFRFLGLKNTDISGENNPLPFSTAVFKFDMIFAILSFFVDLIVMLISFLITLIGLEICFYVHVKIVIDLPKAANNIGINDIDFTLIPCTSFRLRPFRFIGGLFKKVDVNEDGNLDNDNGARGLHLPCDGQKYFISMNDPCPGSGCDCPPSSPPKSTQFFEKKDCDGCDDGGTCTDPDKSCFSLRLFTPTQQDCQALQQLQDWECCVKYNLAISRNVIRLSFFDAWLFGSAYLFQFKYKKNSNGKEKFCGPGSDNSGGDNYKRQKCCPNNKEPFKSNPDPNTTSVNEGNGCNRCLVRGPNTSSDKLDYFGIRKYHKFDHDATVNSLATTLNSNPLTGGDMTSGNGATDINDIIYCNAYHSTKIMSLGSVEMCLDTLNKIEKCISINDCVIDRYTQNSSNTEQIIGTFYENGWDTNTWTKGIGDTSYQNPESVFVKIMESVNCQVGKMFNNKKDCHENELLDEFYQDIKEVSKIYVDIETKPITITFGNQGVFTTPNDEFDEFTFDTKYGQRFSPCGGANQSTNCNQPPNTWSGLDTEKHIHNNYSTVNSERNKPYYYFGLRPGKTAINKLRKDFFFSRQ